MATGADKKNGKAPKFDNKIWCKMYLKIPRNIKAHFKAHCSLRGVSMQQRLVELMRNAITKEDAT